MSLLTEQEIAQFFPSGIPPCSSDVCLARAIESAVIEKIKAQWPIAYWDGCYSDPYFGADHDAPGIGKGGIPLYRLPEGD